MRRFVMVALVALAAGTSPAMLRADDLIPTRRPQRRFARNSATAASWAAAKIGVRYLNGTVWLQGQVADREHYNKVLEAVMATSGVTITRVVPDGLAIDATRDQGGQSAPWQSARDINRAQPVPSTFNAIVAATLAAMMQAVPAPPPAPVPTAPGSDLAEPLARDRRGRPASPVLRCRCMLQAPPSAVRAPVRYDQPAMPDYAWPSYAAYPNYAAVTYPKQYSPTAWPYIGPFYPYPQVPLGWRKVSLEWDDGWWWLDFKDKCNICWWR